MVRLKLNLAPPDPPVHRTKQQVKHQLDISNRKRNQDACCSAPQAPYPATTARPRLKLHLKPATARRDRISKTSTSSSSSRTRALATIVRGLESNVAVLRELVQVVEDNHAVQETPDLDAGTVMKCEDCSEHGTVTKKEEEQRKPMRISLRSKPPESGLEKTNGKLCWYKGEYSHAWLSGPVEGEPGIVARVGGA